MNSGSFRERFRLLHPPSIAQKKLGYLKKESDEKIGTQLELGLKFSTEKEKVRHE